MCGIAGIHLKNAKFVKSHVGLETFANALLLGIEPRGRRATGFVATKPKGLGTVLEKADMTASDFIQVRKELPQGARTVLLHTRLDTKGDPKENNNNHPVVCKTTFTTHNGAIYNDDELFQLHKLERKASVDSEVISALLDKTGLDNAKEALEQFQGAMAIAAIDPIRSPDKLLLAKGEWSPLIVVENDDFIVWASEKKAIEDAWAMVLGTPPKWKRFHTFKEGEFWLIDGNEVQRDKYDVLSAWEERKRRREEREAKKREAYKGSSTDSRTTHYGWGPNGWGDDDRLADEGEHCGATQHPLRRSSNSEEWTKRTDLKARAIARRELKRGRARIMGKVTPDDMKGVPSLVVWLRCSSCHESVLREDIHKSVAWGKMCLDCYDVAIAIAQENADPKNFLNDDEKRVLNNWVKLEDHIHRKALTEIAKETEYPEETVEWLVFRAPKTYTDKNKKVNDLAAELDDRYQEATARLFAEHGITDASDPKQTVEKKASTEVVKAEVAPGAGPFVSCTKHARIFRQEAGCEDCAKEFSTKSSEKSRFVGQPNLNKQLCWTCANKRGRTQKGRKSLGALIFCNTHWTKCTFSIDDDRKEGDGLDAVATDERGLRYCHFCARGRKGLVFDGSHKALGYEVRELPV